MRTAQLLRSAARAALLAGLVALPACKDSTGDDNASGSLSFQYAGALSGSFSAEGQLRSTTGVPTQPFAVATRDTLEGQPLITIFAVAPRADGRAEFINFSLDEVSTAQTLPLDPASCVDVGAGCNLGVLGFNIDFSVENQAPGERYFLTDAGSVQITDINRNRVRGTFTAGAYGVIAATDSTTADSTVARIQVTRGQFDVPFVSRGSLPFNRMPASAGPLLSFKAPAGLRSLPLLRARAPRRLP